MTDTPRQIAISMLGHVKSQSTIIHYITFKTGYAMTERELWTIKRDGMPRDTKLENQKKADPIVGFTGQIKVPDGDPLLRALERHHGPIVNHLRQKAAMA